MSKIVTKSIKMPDGAEITIETGKLAKQADGSVVVRMGNTMLLATVVSATDAKEDVDFLPLSVDYQEKFASSGKIPGGFLKREGKLSDHEVLISRLVDRALRPLFPDDYHADTQVMISMISHDDKHLFNGLPNPFEATRYHSLVLNKNTVPNEFEVTATSDDGEIMGIRHKKNFIEGVQFHPESILTTSGKDLLNNFLKMSVD